MKFSETFENGKYKPLCSIDIVHEFYNGAKENCAIRLGHINVSTGNVNLKFN